MACALNCSQLALNLPPYPPSKQVMAYEACRDVMEALRSKYSGPLQVREGPPPCWLLGCSASLRTLVGFSVRLPPWRVEPPQACADLTCLPPPPLLPLPYNHRCWTTS